MEKGTVQSLFPPAFFVTATDTEIGKTFVSSMLTLGLSAGYWKPIRTGMPYTDTDYVREHTGLDDSHFFKESYMFAPHISPHEAARMKGVTIDLAKIQIPDFNPLPHLVVEGAGGVMVPLNDKETILDLILHLGLPVLIVVRSTLGTINHTTLTVDKLRQHNVPIIGVVMNGPRHESNRKAIEHYAQVPVLAEVETMSTVTPYALKTAFQYYFAGNNEQTNKFENIPSLAAVHPG
jgi:dethiobiotin synthetase